VTDRRPPKKRAPRRKTRGCPICGKPAAEAFFPFCSARCKQIDLNRWLSGSYVIPGSEDGPGTAGDPEE
jgi:endogenous inhibitor of DNA gyrase (YacG/DUF329 family)